MEKEIVIKLSNTKRWFATLGSFALVIFGVFLFKNTPYIFSPEYFSAIIEKLIGISCVVFFGFCALIGVIKLFEDIPGIIINYLGVNIVGAYLIKWDDIIDYSTAKEVGADIFLLYVENPDEYIAAATGFKKFGMKMNMKEYKTPFSISPRSYQCSFDELKAAILEGMKQAALAKSNNP